MQLYTSLNPKMVRSAQGQDVTSEYQRECIQSWTRAGFNVATLNNLEETERLSKKSLDVRFVEIQTKRPRISHFLEIALNERHKVAGIVNDDCLFVGDASVGRRIREVAERGMLLMERVNLDHTTFANAASCNGFDAFFFNTDFVREISINNNLHIGDTWWDYIFPLSYREAGGNLFQSAPYILHLNHPLNWNEENYELGGRIAKAVFSGKQGLPTVEGEDPQALSAFAGQVLEFLRTVAVPVNLRGEGIGARLINQLALNSLDSSRRDNSRIPVDVLVDPTEIARQAVEEYRVNREPYRMVGELLCTLAIIVRKLRPNSRLADTLFAIGDDLQYPLYAGEKVNDPLER